MDLVQSSCYWTQFDSVPLAPGLPSWGVQRSPFRSEQPFFWSRNPGLVRVKHGWEERKKRWRPGGSDRPVWTSICESEARALEAMTTRPCQLEGPHGFIGQKHTFIPWLAGARLQKTESKLARTCSMWYKVSYIYIYI